jgi:septum formation protein
MSSLHLPKIYLASQSPRRKNILQDAGFPIELVKIDVEETYPEDIPLKNIAEYLAQKKMAAIKSIPEDGVLLTADSIVVKDGAVLGKPEDYDHAFEMLSELSGDKHTVYTGVCMKSKAFSTSFTDKTEVKFYKLSSDEIHYYLSKEKPFDKAGSYGIQDWIGMCRVKNIKGNFFNVMGLPVQRVFEILKTNKFI